MARQNLVFARERAAGFCDVTVRLIYDQHLGVCASHNDAKTPMNGVLLFLFDKGRNADELEGQLEDLNRAVLQRPADADGLAQWTGASRRKMASKPSTAA